MFSIMGKYGEAIIYADFVEESALSQIYGLLSCEVFKDAHVRIILVMVGSLW